MPKTHRLRMPDGDDLHVYGGLVILAAGVALFHPGLGLAVLGLGLIAIGALYTYAAARAERQKPRTADFGALNTASPPADEGA